MITNFLNGTPEQHEDVREAIEGSTYNFARLAGTVNFEWVDNPSGSLHNEVAATTSSPEGGDPAGVVHDIKIKPGWSSDPRERRTVIIHELGHAVASQLPLNAVARLCALFGAPTSAWRPEGYGDTSSDTWTGSVLEAFCECFKDVFYADRAYNNKTRWKLTRAAYPAFVRIIEQSCGGYGGDPETMAYTIRSYQQAKDMDGLPLEPPYGGAAGDFLKDYEGSWTVVENGDQPGYTAGLFGGATQWAAEVAGGTIQIKSGLAHPGDGPEYEVDDPQLRDTGGELHSGSIVVRLDEGSWSTATVRKEWGSGNLLEGVLDRASLTGTVRAVVGGEEFPLYDGDVPRIAHLIPGEGAETSSAWDPDTSTLTLPGSQTVFAPPCVNLAIVGGFLIFGARSWPLWWGDIDVGMTGDASYELDFEVYQEISLGAGQISWEFDGSATIHEGHTVYASGLP